MEGTCQRSSSFFYSFIFFAQHLAPTACMLESLKEPVKNKFPGTRLDSKAVDVGRDQDWIPCSTVHTGQCGNPAPCVLSCLSFNPEYSSLPTHPLRPGLNVAPASLQPGHPAPYPTPYSFLCGPRTEHAARISTHTDFFPLQVIVHCFQHWLPD